MATRILRRQLPATVRTHPHAQPRPGRRPFFSLASSETQTLAASRTLPYAPMAVYDLIADIDSYASFLPYCTASRVTAWTPELPSSSIAASDGGKGRLLRRRRWPWAGDLTVGFGAMSRSYSSRVYCVPGRVVEAVSGPGGLPTLSASELAALGTDAAAETARAEGDAGDGTFETLATRWSVAPLRGEGGGGSQEGRGGDGERTRVELSIRYRFANPIYQLATEKFSSEMAGLMIEAFEKRAREMLGPRA